MEIRKYRKADEDAVLKVIENEGEDWICYWGDDASAKYRKLLAESLTFVAIKDGVICGYLRSKVDGDFGVYIIDLLVAHNCRGNSIGKKLMECLYEEYPNQAIYVLSGVDEYYSKIGYKREGSIYSVVRG